MTNNQEIHAKFSQKLLYPRHWLTWLGVGILYLLVQLPYPIIYQLGKGLGFIACRLISKRRETAKQNLKLCFPDMFDTERKKMLHDNFVSTGMAVFETGIAWFWSDKRLKKHINTIGYENIIETQKKGQGILLVGIHFLTLELGARIIGMNTPGVGVYRPNDNPVIDYIQLKGRLKSNKYMLDRHNIKGMIRALKNGELVWYAPDHDYGKKNSVFVPFFAVEKAATTIGTTTLVKLGHPAIIPFTPKREEKGQYTIYVSPPIEDYPLNDEIKAATLMNKSIEKEILRAPEQYMWLHRRFKTRPEGEPSLYTKNIQKR